MKKNFDEIIKSSLKEEYNNFICPYPQKELTLLKAKLRKRIRIIRFKTYASACAIILLIPFMLVLYTNIKIINIEPNQLNKNKIVDRTQNELIKESTLIINGIVENINNNDNTNNYKDVQVSIKEILKGTPYNNKVVTVYTNDIEFTVEENVILFLSNVTDKKHYIITGNCQGKYTLDKLKENFINCNSEKINLSSFRYEINN